MTDVETYDPSNDPSSDEYVAPWRRQAESLGGTAPAAQNRHLPQLKERADKRSEALDRAIEQSKQAAPSNAPNFLRG